MSNCFYCSSPTYRFCSKENGTVLPACLQGVQVDCDTVKSILFCNSQEIPKGGVNEDKLPSYSVGNLPYQAVGSWDIPLQITAWKEFLDSFYFKIQTTAAGNRISSNTIRWPNFLTVSTLHTAIYWTTSAGPASFTSYPAASTAAVPGNRSPYSGRIFQSCFESSGSSCLPTVTIHLCSNCNLFNNWSSKTARSGSRTSCTSDYCKFSDEKLNRWQWQRLQFIWFQDVFVQWLPSVTSSQFIRARGLLQLRSLIFQAVRKNTES